MAKPWGRYEIGFMGHRKFLALTGNAIALWWEGKNYCDAQMTDGLIPTEALKMFRFSGTKPMQLLLASCGQKPDGTPYAPLWEPHVAGYKMHDYLNHNDCREEVLARIDDADDVNAVRRLKNKERQAAFRALRKDALRVTPRNSDITPVTTTPTETPTETVPLKPKEQVLEGGAPSAPPLRAPIHDTSHRKHAICGRICLHASLFGDFVRRRNHDGAETEIRDWANAVLDEWTGGPHRTTEPGDQFEFWKARYAERWPVVTPKTGGKWAGWQPRAGAK